MALTPPLMIDACGAVTPVGLTSLASCAALRAGISRVVQTTCGPPFDMSFRVARVRAGSRVRTTPREWLLNLAARAIGECVASLHPSAHQTALVVCAPEECREHPWLAGVPARALLHALQERTGLELHPASRVLGGGPGDLHRALAAARDLLQLGTVSRVLVGGVDSLLDDADIARLRHMGRLQDDATPQGVVPGEGAAFIAVSLTGRESPYVPIAAVLGTGGAHERKTVACEEYSTGEALTEAVRCALVESGAVSEPDVEFVVSNHNGERYAAWETTMSHARTYRTRRDRMRVVFPASSIGELGASASTLSVIVAAVGLARGYLPGRVGVCEARSEGAARSACVVAAAAGPSAFLAAGLRRPRHSPSSIQHGPTAG